MCPLGSPRRGRLSAFAATLCTAAPAFAGVRFTPVAGPPDALVISSAAVSTYSLPHTLNIPYGLFAVPGRGMFELGSTEYVAVPCTDAQVASALAYRTYAVSKSCGLFAVALSVVTPAGASLPAGSQAYEEISFGGTMAISKTSVAVISPRRDAAAKFVVSQLYQAYQAEALQLPFLRGKETTYKVKFMGLADPARSAGDQVGKIYRQT